MRHHGTWEGPVGLVVDEVPGTLLLLGPRGLLVVDASFDLLRMLRLSLSAWMCLCAGRRAPWERFRGAGCEPWRAHRFGRTVLRLLTIVSGTWGVVCDNGIFVTSDLLGSYILSGRCFDSDLGIEVGCEGIDLE